MIVSPFARKDRRYSLLQFNVISFLDQPEIQLLAYHMGMTQRQHFLHHFAEGS
jgi:hypothetical protein